MRAPANSSQDSLRVHCRHLLNGWTLRVKLWESCQFSMKRANRQIYQSEKKLVEGPHMRHLFLEASSRVLLVLIICMLSNAQTAKSDDSISISTTADVDRSPVADGFRAQDYMSSSGRKVPDDQPPGYIGGTILDQSGAVNVGANVRLVEEGPNFPPRGKVWRQWRISVHQYCCGIFSIDS
jgi:hypothetical protein